MPSDEIMRGFCLSVLVLFAAFRAQTPDYAPDVLPPAARAKLVASLEAARHPSNYWRDTAPINADGSVNGYVEIALGDRRKWEFDIAANRRALDRVMPADVGGYPINYGFVPQTVSYDGDPFDILVLGPSIPGGAQVHGAVMGVMFMEDEKGLDSKVVVSPTAADGRPLHALTTDVQRQVGDYFRRYKLHEPGAFSRVPGWGTASEGVRLVRTTHAFFRECRQPAASPCRVKVPW
jgi:inorganic pyrophosphatase